MADDICAKFVRRQFPERLHANHSRRRRLPHLALSRTHGRFALLPRARLAFQFPVARDSAYRENLQWWQLHFHLLQKEVALIFHQYLIAQLRSVAARSEIQYPQPKSVVELR